MGSSRGGIGSPSSLDLDRVRLRGAGEPDGLVEGEVLTRVVEALTREHQRDDLERLPQPRRTGRGEPGG